MIILLVCQKFHNELLTRLLVVLNLHQALPWTLRANLSICPRSPRSLHHDIEGSLSKYIGRGIRGFSVIALEHQVVTEPSCCMMNISLEVVWSGGVFLVRTLKNPIVLTCLWLLGGPNVDSEGLPHVGQGARLFVLWIRPQHKYLTGDSCTCGIVVLISLFWVPQFIVGFIFRAGYACDDVCWISWSCVCAGILSSWNMNNFEAVTQCFFF